MENMNLYKSTPIGSLITRPEAEAQFYINNLPNVPPALTKIIFSSNTGSYIHGLAKTYDISESFQPSIAFAMLEISIGKKTLSQLPGTLSTELQIPADQAEKMATEIEKDIFGPVKAELDAFLEKQGGEDSKPNVVPAPASKPSQPKNVLDLKEITAAKKQERLPAKPVQQQLPKRQLPPPLTPPQVAGGTKPPQAPKFPLPPRTSPPPKPPITPLNFTNY